MTRSMVITINEIARMPEQIFIVTLCHGHFSFNNYHNYEILVLFFFFFMVNIEIDNKAGRIQDQ